MSELKNKKAQPHDDYFRQSMAESAMSVSLFREHLPETLTSKMDFSTLVQQKESFIDAEASVREVDCLYEVQISGELSYIYVLVEHQTKPDRTMAYRLIKYMIRITEHHLKKHKKDKHLPFIYPMVLYGGKGKYTAPTTLWDMYKDPNFVKEMYGKFYQLIDVGRMNDIELTDDIVGIMMYIYKYAKSKDVVEKIGAIQNLLSYMNKRTSVDYIVCTYQYILKVSDIDESQIKELTNKFLEILETDEEKEKIMTAAERLEQKGRSEGIQQGIELTALNMFKKGLDIDTISEITGIVKDKLIEMSTKH